MFTQVELDQHHWSCYINVNRLICEWEEAAWSRPSCSARSLSLSPSPQSELVRACLSPVSLYLQTVARSKWSDQVSLGLTVQGRFNPLFPTCSGLSVSVSVERTGTLQHVYSRSSLQPKLSIKLKRRISLPPLCKRKARDLLWVGNLTSRTHTWTICCCRLQKCTTTCLLTDNYPLRWQ